MNAGRGSTKVKHCRGWRQRVCLGVQGAKPLGGVRGEAPTVVPILDSPRCVQRWAEFEEFTSGRVYLQELLCAINGEMD